MIRLILFKSLLYRDFKTSFNFSKNIGVNFLKIHVSRNRVSRGPSVNEWIPSWRKCLVKFFWIDTLLTQAHIYELAWSKQHRALFFYTTSDASGPGLRPRFFRRPRAWLLEKGLKPMLARILKFGKGQEKLSFFDYCIYQKAQRPALN